MAGVCELVQPRVVTAVVLLLLLLVGGFVGAIGQPNVAKRKGLCCSYKHYNAHQ